MAQTHYFPDGPRPLHVGHRQRAGARDRQRRHGRRRDPRRQRQPDRARTPRRDVIAGARLGPRLPARRPDRRRGRRAGRHARRRDPRPAHARLGLDGDPARARAAARRLPGPVPARLRPLRRRLASTSREDIAIPLTPFFGTMGVCPEGASAQPVMPPGTFGGNMDTRQLDARARRCTCRCRSRARCSAAATRTPPRATARSA